MYNLQLLTASANKIVKLLDENQAENERRVWAFSKRFEKRIVIMLRLKRYLESCIYWAKDSSDSHRATPLMKDLENLISTFLDIAEMQPACKKYNRARPSMVEQNKAWFNLIDRIYEFAHSFN